MNDSDLIWGAHSGLQKAVRRGDLDLCKTCFDLLWSETKHKNWLKWRLPSIVIEEAWYFGGRLKVFNDRRTDDPNEWLKFLYELTLIRKAKDADAVMRIPASYSGDSMEYVESTAWSKKLGDPPTNIEGISYSIASACRESRKLTKYEEQTLAVLYNRANMGGMLGDRIMSLGGIVLLTNRPIDEARIDDLIDSGLKKWKKEKGRKPRIVNMPWYAFDMHTQVGKIAMSIWTKRKSHKYDIKDFDSTWFYLESGYVPETMRVENRKAPDAFEEKWWPILTQHFFMDEGSSIEKRTSLWNEKIRSEVEGIVAWLLEKRS